MNTIRSLYSLILTALLASALVVPAQAQQLIAWPIGSPGMWRHLLPGQPIRPMPMPPAPFPHPLPGPRPDPRPVPTPVPTPTPTPSPVVPPELTGPVTLTGYTVTGTVREQVADLTFHITFHNPTNQRLEGVLLLPLPADTVLSGFKMTMGGKMVKGELLESTQARTVYENIVRSMRDPGLLELADERLMRARVFPIEPHSDITVELGLTQVLKKSGDLVSLRVPIRSARMTQGERRPAKVDLTLESALPIRTLYSPVPSAKIKRDGERKATITYEAPASANEDLDLFYSLQADPLAAGLLAFKEDGEDGFFLLTLAPKAKAEPGAETPKDLVLIVDRSGSMEEGGKMEQARRALSYVISKLSAKDRFGIVDFATDTNQFESSLVEATPDNKKRALRYIERIEAAGGTNIEGGLHEGLKLLAAAPGRVPMVFFMTDGLPTIGTTDVQALLRQAQERNSALKARMFSFGVGSDVNTLFLDKLAASNRGAGDYVAPGENIEHKVSALYGKVAKPALTDVKLSWEGLDVVQVYPRPVEDVFYGGELLVMGRYKAEGKGRLVVTGQAGGKPARFEFPIDLPKTAERNGFVPRLWANMRVAHELDAIRLSGRPADAEVVKDIVKLAKRYGIVTPYTSYLVTEEGTDLRRAQNAASVRFEAMSADAASSGFGGGAGTFQRARRDSSAIAAMRGMSFGGASGAGAPAPAAAPMLAMAKAREQVFDEAKAAGRTVAATRSIGGKTFYRRGERWVDGEFELAEEGALKTVKIAYLSDAYFKLASRLGRYLSVGPKVTLVDGNTAYEIE